VQGGMGAQIAFSHLLKAVLASWFAALLDEAAG
jgi:hypothetical protein